MLEARPAMFAMVSSECWELLLVAVDIDDVGDVQQHNTLGDNWQWTWPLKIKIFLSAWVASGWIVKQNLAVSFCWNKSILKLEDYSLNLADFTHKAVNTSNSIYQKHHYSDEQARTGLLVLPYKYSFLELPLEFSTIQLYKP